MASSLRSALRSLGIRKVAIVRVYRGDLWLIPPDCPRLGCGVVLTDTPTNRRLLENWYPYPVAYVSQAPPLRYRFTHPEYLRKDNSTCRNHDTTG